MRGDRPKKSRLTALPLFLTVTPVHAQEPTAALIPKVLLVGIDGVRPDVLRHVATPNIDRLAHEGALLERAFHTTPICSRRESRSTSSRAAAATFAPRAPLALMSIEAS